MDNPKKCEHPACACPASADSDYCSTYCEGAGDISDITCNCGHAHCKGHAA